MNPSLLNQAEFDQLLSHYRAEAKIETGGLALIMPGTLFKQEDGTYILHGFGSDWARLRFTWEAVTDFLRYDDGVLHFTLSPVLFSTPLSGFPVIPLTIEDP